MEDKDYLAQILPKLAEPMPYKWRVQSFSKNKPMATCVAYIDARDVMDRLDKVCENGWMRDHKEIKGHIYAGIAIIMPSGMWWYKWDCGVESNTDAEKGEASDSFKRAAVNWGIGRFLYDLEIQYVDANEKKTKDNRPYVVDKSKRVYDLTKFINDRMGKPKQEEKKPKPKKELTFIERCGKAKIAIGAEKFEEALISYQANKPEDIPEDLRDEFLNDLRKQVK